MDETNCPRESPRGENDTWMSATGYSSARPRETGVANKIDHVANQIQAQ